MDIVLLEIMDLRLKSGPSFIGFIMIYLKFKLRIELGLEWH